MHTIKVDTLIFALIILNILLAGYLTYANKVGSEEGICLIKGTDSKTDCSDVQNSVYGSFLGIKVSYLGLFAFLVLFLIFLYTRLGKKYKKETKILFLVISLFGALIAVYFLIIQFFFLKTLCLICVIIDVSTILIFILGYAEYLYKKNAPFGFSP